MITIFHHARCSKSRAALMLAEQAADRLDEPLLIRDYVAEPLNYAELETLLAQLGQPASVLLREDDARTLCPAVLAHREDSIAVLKALAKEPRLLQRPIVVRQGRAIIGRPPEAILALFD